MASQPYEEILEWFQVDGTEVLRAGPVDLALKEAAVANAQDGLDKLRHAEPPPHVLQAREEASCADLPEGQRAEAREKIREWEKEQAARWSMLQESLRLLTLQQANMQKEPEGEGVTIRREVYRMRRILDGEYEEIEDAHTDVDLEESERRVARRKLERVLLGHVLLGRSDGEGNDLGLVPVPEMDRLIVQILIDRMNFANGLTHELASFFRGGRRAAGHVQH